MSGVEVTVSVEVGADCEIRSMVNRQTGEVELTFTDNSILILGFNRRAFKQFVEHLGTPVFDQL